MPDPISPLTIAVLGGTGKEGPGLALRWAKAGYRVIIGSRQLEKAQAVAQELNQFLGGSAVSGMENTQAACQAEVCVLTVLHSAHHAALESLKESLQGKILVDATARVDFRDPRPPSLPSAARSAQDYLGPGVRVVAAFQNVPATTLKRNLGERLNVDVLVCADDPEAARVVLQLSEAAGMNAFSAGNLDNAVVVEGLTSLLIAINKYYGSHTAAIRVIGVKD
jgi:hypothetical protein